MRDEEPEKLNAEGGILNCKTATVERRAAYENASLFFARVCDSYRNLDVCICRLRQRSRGRS